MQITAASLSTIAVAAIACMSSTLTNTVSAAPAPFYAGVNAGIGFGGYPYSGYGGYGGYNSYGYGGYNSYGYGGYGYGGYVDPYYLSMYGGFGVGLYNGAHYYGNMGNGLWVWADGSKDHDAPEASALLKDTPEGNNNPIASINNNAVPAAAKK